jgi:hypothetical protein
LIGQNDAPGKLPEALTAVHPRNFMIKPISPKTALRSYFHAKDENRPHLLNGVFDKDATLEIVNRSSAIAFPAVTIGLDEIANVLVRNFGQTYENVYSFYMACPGSEERSFACNWLVAMSEKGTRGVRVGCGRYDWQFTEEPPHLASHLAITIEIMQVFPPDILPAILTWIGSLSYPWSSASEVCEYAPKLPELSPILRYLSET